MDIHFIYPYTSCVLLASIHSVDYNNKQHFTTTCITLGMYMWSCDKVYICFMTFLFKTGYVYMAHAGLRC